MSSENFFIVWSDCIVLKLRNGSRLVKQIMQSNFKDYNCRYTVHRISFYTSSISDALTVYLLFYVPLENFCLIWRRHHYRWKAAKFRAILGAQGLWAGRDLYHATPAVTRDLRWVFCFCVSSKWSPPFSSHLRHTLGDAEDIHYSDLDIHGSIMFLCFTTLLHDDLVILASPVQITLWDMGCRSFGWDHINRGPVSQ
jgi:hypothetical protein